MVSDGNRFVRPYYDEWFIRGQHSSQFFNLLIIVAEYGYDLIQYMIKFQMLSKVTITSHVHK